MSFSYSNSTVSTARSSPKSMASHSPSTVSTLTLDSVSRRGSTFTAPSTAPASQYTVKPSSKADIAKYKLAQAAIATETISLSALAHPSARLRALTEPAELSPSDIALLTPAELAAAEALLGKNVAGRMPSYNELLVLSTLRNVLFCKSCKRERFGSCVCAAARGDAAKATGMGVR